MTGRPLRFLLLVTGGWVGARAMMLWPGDIAAIVDRALPPPAGVAIAGQPADAAILVHWPAPSPRTIGPVIRRALRTDAPTVPTEMPLAPIVAAALPESQPTQGIIAGLPVPVSPDPPRPRSRLFGSVWAVARGGGGPAGGVPGVQLGGSQAGIRMGYALTGDRRLAIVARASSPLGAGMREAALGVEWQPTRLPVRIVAEHRFALNTGKGGPTLAAVGGVGPLPLAAGFRLEAYAQGGVIGRDGGEGFADAAVRVARPVATKGAVRVDLGGGAWGAAQRGARRVDIGPSLSATLPIGPQPVRLSLDWRQRIAGNAAPGSGLVVTLGADF